MASNISKVQILSLYKTLMRESQKFSNYNFRSYAIRKVRDSFRENKKISDLKEIKKQYDFALENLNIIRRQAAIGNMYKSDKLVIENGH